MATRKGFFARLFSRSPKRKKPYWRGNNPGVRTLEEVELERRLYSLWKAMHSARTLYDEDRIRAEYDRVREQLRVSYNTVLRSPKKRLAKAKSSCGKSCSCGPCSKARSPKKRKSAKPKQVCRVMTAAGRTISRHSTRAQGLKAAKAYTRRTGRESFNICPSKTGKSSYKQHMASPKKGGHRPLRPKSQQIGPRLKLWERSAIPAAVEVGGKGWPHDLKIMPYTEFKRRLLAHHTFVGSRDVFIRYAYSRMMRQDISGKLLHTRHLASPFQLGARHQKTCPVGTEVQTLIFHKDAFDRQRAVRWATQHDFRATKVDEKEHSYRLRQVDPGAFRPGMFRTISLTDGVAAVIGCAR